MQLQDVLNANQALFALSQCKLPAETAYRIGKAINQVKSISKAFEKRRYAFISGIEGVTLADDKQSFNIEGHETEVNDGIKAILEEEVETKFLTISFESLKGIQIEPIHLAALDGWLIVDLQAVDGGQVEQPAVFAKD